jgi:holo-[acyl-carrier protein] synthase
VHQIVGEIYRMGILCGVDIIEINRLRKAFETSGDIFRDKVFTKDEVIYCEGKKAVKFNSYAARFAAKEAVSKAFGTGISEGIGWTDIEILNDIKGKPHVNLFGAAKQKLNEIGAINVSLSISHCENYAVAYATIETKD